MKIEYSMEELIPLLLENIPKYTSNESTSIPYDKARQLMQSILYCINGFLKSSHENHKIAPNEKISARTAYQTGLKLAQDKILQAEDLYKDIISSFCAYENICYYDTVIKGMPEFFLRYDVRFDAANHLLTLDYPLLYEIRNINGIDLIYEYLKNIRLEQLFLKKFSKKQIIKTLSNYHNEHSELIHNVCRIIFRNALACIIVEKPFHELAVQASDLEKINRIVSRLSREELELYLIEKLTKFINSEFEGNKELFHYLASDIRDCTFELKTFHSEE